MKTVRPVVERLDVDSRDVERVRAPHDQLAARDRGPDDPELTAHAAVPAHELLTG